MYLRSLCTYVRTYMVPYILSSNRGSLWLLDCGPTSSVFALEVFETTKC